jgi:hypothetical protein
VIVISLSLWELINAHLNPFLFFGLVKEEKKEEKKEEIVKESLEFGCLDYCAKSYILDLHSGSHLLSWCALFLLINLLVTFLIIKLQGENMSRYFKSGKGKEK